MIPYRLSPINRLKKEIKNLILRLSEGYYRSITSKYDINGYDRIYFYHIPKTGGTSFIHLFLSLATSDPASLYQRLTKQNRVLINRKVFVGWNYRLINRGVYFFAFSHHPWCRLSLPQKTFTITCFRDPIKRVISNYNMLMYYKTNNIPHRGAIVTNNYLGKTFDDFLNLSPREYLLYQLYMFSEELNIDQALERVAKVSHVFFTQKFQQGVFALNQRLKLNFDPLHVNKAQYQAEITPSQRMHLHTILEDEIEFVKRIQENTRDFRMVSPGL